MTREPTPQHRGLFTKYDVYYGQTKAEFVETVKTRIQTERANLYSTQKQLQRETLTLPNYQGYSHNNTDRSMQMVIQVNSTYSCTETLSLSEAIMQFAAAAFSILDYDITYEYLNNSDCLYLLKNGYGPLMYGIYYSAKYYADVIVCFSDPI
ncbi:MAG: hypothetical protein P4M11_15160 [Candidatus Pacebacteria bacterium]|nr:hypothetical protein [Candidatus Paceibacterota bacterium]